jgi:flagellar P-ring protein precursor FlgI
VSHGSITIAIEKSQQTSGTISQMPGSTVQTNTSSTAEQSKIREPKADVKLTPRVTNVGELASALNSLGVPPRDIIAIFQSIKKAGALHADLVLM